MKAVFSKDFSALISQWTAWIIASGIALAGGMLLFVYRDEWNIFDIGQASLQPYFQLIPWLLLLLVPALSMRSIAEEEQRGTLYALFSYPVSVRSVVAGKYLSVFVVSLLFLIPLFFYTIMVYALGMPVGNLDMGVLFANILGVVLLLALFSATGILTSALTKSQIAAFLSAAALNLILYYGIQQLSDYQLSGALDYYLSRTGAYSHYVNFSKGVTELSDIFYFVFLTAAALLIAEWVVEKKKGNPG